MIMNGFTLLFAMLCTVATKPHAAIKGRNRVVGGVAASYREFPHQVSLQQSVNGKMEHFCGGSILNENWVLTAAHCIGSTSSRDTIQIYAGEYNFTAEDESVQKRLVAEFVLHENFKPGPDVGPHDIALIKVVPPFVFGDGIKPIGLPERDRIPHGNSIITGWGSLSNSIVPDFPDVLQKATLSIVELERCQEMWDFATIYDTNICAGGGKNNTCAGDSGGPLIQTDTRNETIQIGIVSWGSIGCGADGRPAVFTRVSHYTDWIVAHTS